MKRKFMSMGVALSICMCALFGTGCSNPDVNNAINGAASYTSTQGEVYNFATKLVKEQLDAPSTAIFPTFESSYVTKMDDLASRNLYPASQKRRAGAEKSGSGQPKSLPCQLEKSHQDREIKR